MVVQKIMEKQVEVPQVYVLSSTYPLEQVDEIRRVLSITPIYAVVCHDIYDFDLARAFDEQIVRTPSEAQSIELAQAFAEEAKMPVLVIGRTAEKLDAIYPSGRREALNV
jgi:hypothetical protein